MRAEPSGYSTTRLGRKETGRFGASRNESCRTLDLDPPREGVDVFALEASGCGPTGAAALADRAPATEPADTEAHRHVSGTLLHTLHDPLREHDEGVDRYEDMVAERMLAIGASRNLLFPRVTRWLPSSTGVESGEGRMRLLLVEDNRELARWLAEILRASRYTIDVAHDGAEADDILRLADYDLVILDLSLPELDGLAVLKRLRARRKTTPVIVLTANASLKGRIAGLDEGADDYLVKPFEVSELEARIRAQLRRSVGQPSSSVACGDLALDTVDRTFTLKGEPLALTPREAGVLEALLRRKGRTLSKAALAETIFGFDDTADASAIEIYVHRVRKKLEGSSVQIATLRGLGYMLRQGGGDSGA